MRIGLEQVGAHYAISSVFRAYPEEGEIFCFDVHRDLHEVFTSGRGKVAIGRASIRSRITEESEDICYAVLHLGDQNLSAAVKRYNALDAADVANFDRFTTDVRAAIRKANLPEIIRLFDRHFENLAYSLTSLFADEQHRILRTILDQTVTQMEDSIRGIYEDHASLLHFLTDAGMTAPPALALAASFAINASLRRAFEASEFDATEIASLFARASADKVTLDMPALNYAASQRMKRAMVHLESRVAGEHTAKAELHKALMLANALKTMPLDVNLWQAQNIWNDLLRRQDADKRSREWREDFRELGHALNISVESLVIEQERVIPA